MALTPSLAVANGAPVTLLISASTDERGKLLPLSDETRERQKTLSFSAPMFKDSVWLVTRCDRTFDYQHLSQLDGQAIGVVRGTYNGTGFDTAAREGRFRVECDTGDSRGRFEKLLLGRTQVLLMYSRWTASEVVQAVQDRYGMLGAREDGAMQRKPFCVLPRPLVSDEVRIAAAHGQHEDALRRINQALIRGCETGGLSQLLHEAGQGRKRL